jgi:hypothetical protein
MVAVMVSGKYLHGRGDGDPVGVSHPMIVHARKVAEHAPDLVDAVMRT